MEVAVYRVYRCEDEVHGEMVLQDRVHKDRVQDRGRVGEARRLDDYAVEARYLAPLVEIQELQQRLDEVLAGGATDAPVPEQHGPLVHPAQKVMVEPNLAELVDEHGGVGHRGLGEHPAQQRRLAAAEEAG